MIFESGAAALPVSEPDSPIAPASAKVKAKAHLACCIRRAAGPVPRVPP